MKVGLPDFSLAFHVIIFGVSGCLVQVRNQEGIWQGFLVMGVPKNALAFFAHSEQALGHVGEHGLSRLPVPLPILPWLGVSLNSYALWFCKNLGLMGYYKRQIWREQQGMVAAYITLTFSPRVHAPLSHATSHRKHKFKYIIIKNFRMMTELYWTRSEALLNAGPGGATQVTCPWRRLFRGIGILCETPWSLKWSYFSEPLPSQNPYRAYLLQKLPES